MKKNNQQLQRLVHFIEEMKKGKHPNATSFVKTLKKLDEVNNTSLACSSKTIKRDIDYLRDGLDAPIDYDPAEKGYFLANRQWTLSELTLGRDELFAELITRKLTTNSLLPCMREHMNSNTDIQMTAGNLEKINTSALASVIHATGKTIDIDAKLSGKILNAWKECLQIKAHYAKSSKEEPQERQLDIHALFLSNSVWYSYAYCHKRQEYRRFALHKFSSVNIGKKKFKRSPEVIEALQNGRFFDFPMTKDIIIHCDFDVADYIQDRQWFDTQEIKALPDGTLYSLFCSSYNMPQPLLV
ncbi:MAG: WYL domain-containing protein [Lentisphaeraceae bacterium]|nr:WYL domain-containing protein [Lentisphaeraceae bacterium]